MISTLKDVREALAYAGAASATRVQLAITKLDALIAELENAEPHVPETNFGNIKPLTDEEVEALALCRRAGRVSVAQVQRTLEIGYNKAGEICQSIVDKGQCDELELSPCLNAAHGIGAKP